MKTLAQWISWASLVLLMLAGILFLAGSVTLDQAKWIMLIATIIWFGTASLWILKNDSTSEQGKS